MYHGFAMLGGVCLMDSFREFSERGFALVLLEEDFY